MIKPEELEKEAKNYETASESVAKVNYPFVSLRTNITCIQKYLECLRNMQKAVLSFSNLSVKDADNLRKVKDDWLHLDEGK